MFSLARLKRLTGKKHNLQVFVFPGNVAASVHTSPPSNFPTVVLSLMQVNCCINLTGIDSGLCQHSTSFCLITVKFLYESARVKAAYVLIFGMEKIVFHTWINWKRSCMESTPEFLKDSPVSRLYCSPPALQCCVLFPHLRSWSIANDVTQMQGMHSGLHDWSFEK